METENYKINKNEKVKEYKKPCIVELSVKKTLGGPTSSNNENKNHYS